MTKGGFKPLARFCTARSWFALIGIQALYVLRLFSSDQFICIYKASVTTKMGFVEIQGQATLAEKKTAF